MFQVHDLEPDSLQATQAGSQACLSVCPPDMQSLLAQPAAGALNPLDRQHNNTRCLRVEMLMRRQYHHHHHQWSGQLISPIYTSPLQTLIWLGWFVKQQSIVLWWDVPSCDKSLPNDWYFVSLFISISPSLSSHFSSEFNVANCLYMGI